LVALSNSLALALARPPQQVEDLRGFAAAPAPGLATLAFVQRLGASFAGAAFFPGFGFGVGTYARRAPTRALLVGLVSVVGRDEAK
jgi:hypothetical protein